MLAVQVAALVAVLKAARALGLVDALDEVRKAVQQQSIKDADDRVLESGTL